MSQIKKSEIKRVITNSLEQLRQAMGWTQKEFADKLSVTPPTISGYLNKDNEKMPDLEFLVNLIRLEEIKNKGLNLSIDSLLSSSFDPITLIKKREGAVSEIKRSIQHHDFLGTYICYYFDQTKSSRDQGYKATRELRYGILCAYDDYEGISGNAVIRVGASFYKQSEYNDALELKKKLDGFCFEREDDTSVDERNAAIRAIFSGIGSVYHGNISFGIQHAFINIQSEVINDQALIILYSPHKRSDNAYIGGIGSVCSVAHGRSHMPTAQKIILSKYELNCSSEEIADYLSMSTAPISSTNEIESLTELYSKLYGEGSAVSAFLDENDRKAILTNRMNQLIRNYLERNFCCVGSVSDEEDVNIYSLIKKSRKEPRDGKGDK